MSDDQYSRIDYRRLIAWPARIERERPLLESVFATAPEKTIFDIGSGTGEHARFFASIGFDVLGVDASDSMLEKANDANNPPSVRFVKGDLRDLADSIDRKRGGAICLGNTLPHVRTGEELDSFSRGLHSSLIEGAPILIQILNYDRIIANGERHLPLNFRPDENGEIVFLRLMRPEADGSVIFYPSTLLLTDDEEEPLKVVSSRRVPIRGWQSGELVETLANAGFTEIELWGDVERSAFEADSSSDIVIIGRA